MKIVLDIKNNPIENDILFYNGVEWEAISKHKFLGELSKENEQLKLEIANGIEQIDKLVEELKLAKEQINEKLKEYHDILKIISKGE